MRVPDVPAGRQGRTAIDEIEELIGETPAIGGRGRLNAVISGLLEPAKVALAAGRPEVTEPVADALLENLIAVIAAAMPDHLQRQDKRLQDAKALLQLIRQTRG